MALFAWAPGREAYREEGYSLRYGRAVAELHDASDDFRSPHPRFRLDASTLLDRPLDRIQPGLAHRSDDRAYVLGLASRLRERLAELPAGGLEWGFCHGDTLGSNAHLDADTIVHFDLDDCGPGWRAYDLATYRWIWTWQAPEAAEARWAEFPAGYRERLAPRELDLTAIPLLVALRELWVVGAQVGGMGLRWGRWWVSDGYFDKRLQFLRDWEERHPR